MKNDHIPPPRPKSERPLADTQPTSKKRPWSKPIIRDCDGVIYTTSGPKQEMYEAGNYHPQTS